MKQLKLIGIISIWLGLDLISKHFFYNLNYLDHSNIIDSVLNQGISRSLPVPFIVILGVSVIGIGAILRLYKTKYIWYIITGVLLAGTLGNFIDRIVYGGVRDFINIGFFNFPIFNIADIMLTIGVWLRMLQVILEKKK